MTILVCAVTDLSERYHSRLDHVVSILDPGDPVPAELTKHPNDRLTSLRFHDVIANVPGMQGPDARVVERLIEIGNSLSGKVDFVAEPRVLIHCHMGISRSTAAAAIIMSSALGSGHDDEVFRHLGTIRPIAWPNSLMISLADDLLERRGEMNRALRTFFARQATRRPDLVDIVSGAGRDHEVIEALGHPSNRPRGAR